MKSKCELHEGKRDIKKEPNEITGIKNTVSDMRHSLDWTNGRLHLAGDTKQKPTTVK